MSSLNGVNVLQRSSLYRTEPVGLLEQEWFVNCVTKVATVLSSHSLLRVFQQIESNMGRKRTIRKGSRTIDMDILFYGHNVVEENGLMIPHPELHKRRFVLTPLCEIAPNFVHPVCGVSVKELLNSLEDKSEVVKLDQSAS
jgi:2-amino-4-hydroxy-6-hydroxymethyldihydropteridine pyrophosphokinase